MMFPPIGCICPPVFLYAETHYRFRYFWSLLRRRIPELIADAPHRLEPGNHLPVLLLAKDAHQFPCVLERVEVTLRSGGRIVAQKVLIDRPVSLRDPLWWNVVEIPLDNVTGWLECDVVMTASVNGKRKVWHNDNHPTSTRRPLRVFVAPSPLPRFDSMVLGEGHSHSSATDDQVEFGSPVGASVALARGLGLGFFCVTDHSYDLDDRTDNYLEHDPALPKWHALQHAVDEVNRTVAGFAVIRGEEVSCRNVKGRNVHFLVLGSREFIPGSGDGAERWFHTRSEHSIVEVLQRKGHSAATFAAHALEPVPFLQRVLLGRGFWTRHDLEGDLLDGMQFANGKQDAGFSSGYAAWVRLLLKGHRLATFGGNDAHGNFNRFRQVGIPFLAIRESDDQLFGKTRTAVFVPTTTEEAILDALKTGRSVVTDGPVGNLRVQGHQTNGTSIGSTLPPGTYDVSVEARSSEEFGPLTGVTLFRGLTGDRNEQRLLQAEKINAYEFSRTMKVEVPARGYIRLEVASGKGTSFDQECHFCITNPVWFGEP